MDDKPHSGSRGTHPEEASVWWEPAHFRPEEIEAVLPDGTRLRPVLVEAGRRLAFERKLPLGTSIYRGGRRAWIVGVGGQLLDQDAD